MCGFVGYLSPREDSSLKNDLTAANARLSHRGPDGTGIFFDDDAGVGLAHRRLSVIDLSEAGRQPMTDETGRIVIVYNGEVYNFKSIRKTLIASGRRFHSDSDTEVVLKAYQKWGVEAFQRFVGMFALAIWDGPEKQLVLARDRMGLKPLYYRIDGDRLFFASELKALMAFRSLELRIDPEAIPLFLHYQYIPGPRTVFERTCKLLPGHLLTCRHGVFQTRAWWRIPLPCASSGPNYTSERDAVDGLDELLTQAVSDRLISDVPLGALLSGGIDSSIVVALMQKQKSSPVETFSVGFNEAEYNEAPWAARIARYLGTRHTELYVTPAEALALVPRLADIFDEPFADPSAIATTLVCRLARSRLTVALSGDGGDELLAGYVRYAATDTVARSIGRLPALLRRVLARGLETVPRSWVAAWALPVQENFPQRFAVANFQDKWQKLIRQLWAEDLSSMYRASICLWSEPEIADLTGCPLPQSAFEAIFRQTDGWPVLDRLMRVDQETYLPDAMLTKVDRASMSESLEVRVPLLDHRVVEFLNTLSCRLKSRQGRGKILLRKLLEKYLPRGFFDRPKMGFAVPVDRWLRGPLKPLLTDYLSAERLRKEGLFDIGCVTRKIDEHLSGRTNHQYRLWALLMWQMWRDRWTSV